MESIAAQILPRIADGAVCFPPNLPAGARLREALGKTAPGKLPPILTFRQISAAVRMLPDAGPEKIISAAHLANPDPPDDDNTLEIYAELREKSARAPAADLQLAGLWSGFFREMNERNLKLPASEAETLARIAAANTPAARAALSEINAELFNLWRKFYARENTPAAQHRQALARLADRWRRPLFSIAPACAREPLEIAFYERIQSRGGECFLIPPADSAAGTFVRRALDGEAPGDADVELLREHFGEYREGGAASLSDAAELALSAVAGFAADGAKKIGVVVYDRVLARRMNAMALAADKFIADHDGWRANTLAFGAALRMLVDAGADSFSPDSLSELLRAPPLFAGRDFSRERADAEWRGVLQKEPRLPARYDGFADSTRALRAAAGALTRLREKFAGRRPAAEWLEIVCAEANDGALAEWRAGDAERRGDAAADRVMELLARARRSVADERALLDAREFRAWFSRVLDKPVRVAEGSGGVFFVSPAGAAMRKFDAIVLLGGGADYMPAAAPTSFLSERERRALGLPGRDDWLARERERFCGLTAECGRVALIWRGAGGREDVRPSPYWDLLKDGLRGAGILEGDFPPPRRMERPAVAAGIFPPQPARAGLKKLPARLSATSCDRLTECPYLFFARDILKLEEDDAKASLSPALLGIAAHGALARFAGSDLDETDVEKIRLRLDGILAELPEEWNRPGFALVLARWRARAHMFAEWESQRRLAGWRTVGREEWAELLMELEGGEDVVLHGRIDRVDANGEVLGIVDYKTGSVPTQLKLDSGEVAQLPLYAALKAGLGGEKEDGEGEGSGESGSREGEGEGGSRVGGVGGSGGVPEWLLCRPFPGRGDKVEIFPKSGGGSGGGEVEMREHFAGAVVRRFRVALGAILSGAALPASGVPSSCARCAARGLCRRDHWAGEGEGN